MNLERKIEKNPFAWLAFISVALCIYGQFALVSIPFITYITLGFVFMYVLSKNKLGMIFGYWYVPYMCAALAYVFLVATYSPEISTNMTNAILFQTLICVCIFAYSTATVRASNRVVILICLSVLVLAVTILTDETLFSTLSSAAEDDDVYYTLGDFNRNTIGIILGIGCLFMLYLGIARRKIWLALCILTMILGLVTGSRKVLLTILIGSLLFCFVYARYCQQKKIGKKIKTMLLVLILVIALIFLCFNNPMLYNIIGIRFEGLFNALLGNTGGDASALERMAMTEKAWDMFMEKPFFGWGIEGFAANTRWGVYSHNNYTETLVSFGLVGFVIMYSFKLMLVIRELNLIKNVRDTAKATQYTIVFSVMVICLVLDFAAVSMNNAVVNLPFALAASDQYLFLKEGV